MNNDLEQFSEERLMELIHESSKPEIEALARIALSVKQAKPLAWEVKGILCHTKEEADVFIGEPEPLYDTPQPAHAEQDGWTSSDAANAALVMLDRIDTTGPVDDDRIEGIQRIIRQLVNSPAIPDGWKLVPIQPTEEMINAWDEDMGQSYARVHAEQIGEDELVFAYQAMLAAAPNPESE